MGIGGGMQGFVVALSDITNQTFSSRMSSIFAILVISALLMGVFLFFVFFYKWLSKRDLLALNLSQYNRSKHPTLRKLWAVGLYLCEYILILPFVMLLWFSAFLVILLLLVEGHRVDVTLVVSTALVIVTRVFAYTKKQYAIEISKLIPFVALATFLLSPSILDAQALTKPLSELALLFDSVVTFLIAIFLVEIMLRILYTFKLWRTSEEI